VLLVLISWPYQEMLFWLAKMHSALISWLDMCIQCSVNQQRCKGEFYRDQRIRCPGQLRACARVSFVAQLTVHRNSVQIRKQYFMFNMQFFISP
jgi:hypothetical protein